MKQKPLCFLIQTETLHLTLIKRDKAIKNLSTNPLFPCQLLSMSTFGSGIQAIPP